MVNYGDKKEFQVPIESVDYYPEIAGVKVSNFPIIAVFSILPLWFNQFELSILTLFSLITLCYRAARKEDEGHPFFLNATLVKASKLLPKAIRERTIPSFAHIKTHTQELRR